MIKKEKILSLLLALLMLGAAAITVNKAIFGHTFLQADTVRLAPDADAEATTVANGDTLVIHTQGLPGTITGYAGPVPMDIYIYDGKISEIRPLPNAETPSFFKRAEAVLPAWIGKTPEEAQTIKVDAVSGATYSSTAIINNVRVGLAAYDGAAASNSSSVPLKVWVALAVTLAACVVPLFVKNRIYHNVQLAANVIVLGFWAGQFLDYALILKIMSDGAAWPLVLVAAVMLVAAFIYPIFGRPQHYCTYICPLGSAQQLMGHVCGYKIKMAASVVKGLDWFRKVLWAALMLLLWADSLTAWMDLELFQAFQFRSASAGIIIAAVAFVLLSTVVSRPYCRFVCPTGSLFKRAENIG